MPPGRQGARHGSYEHCDTARRSTRGMRCLGPDDGHGVSRHRAMPRPRLVAGTMRMRAGCPGRLRRPRHSGPLQPGSEGRSRQPGRVKPVAVVSGRELPPLPAGRRRCPNDTDVSRARLGVVSWLSLDEAGPDALFQGCGHRGRRCCARSRPTGARGSCRRDFNPSLGRAHRRIDRRACRAADNPSPLGPGGRASGSGPGSGAHPALGAVGETRLATVRRRVSMAKLQSPLGLAPRVGGRPATLAIR
ncbi:hypothetical protein BH23ACT2_BH23ACT2_20670 [soil metagenome]